MRESITMSKYDKYVKGITIDVYDVLEAFDVRCPALQHAIKKQLQPGDRGSKGTLEDLGEALDSLHRAITLEEGRE